MNRVVQISILGKVSGNVNADEVIGTRITLKKMYSSSGEVLPFISARAIKYAIRQALKERGYLIDEFEKEVDKAEKKVRLVDSGNPLLYVDNDLFGYMVAVKREQPAARRQSPIAISYFKALKDTPIRAEFCGRFPRTAETVKTKGDREIEQSPDLFEVEVAEFIGRLNVIIYDYIGNFGIVEEKVNKRFEEVLKEIGMKIPKDVEELKEMEHRIRKALEICKEKVTEEKIKKKIKKILEEWDEHKSKFTSKNRLKDFLEILLTPSYVLPRRTNSLNIPEYIAAIVVLSEKGPLPVFQYLDYDFENNRVYIEKLEKLVEREEIKEKIRNNNVKILLIDYEDKITKIPESMGKVTVKTAISEILNFM